MISSTVDRSVDRSSSSTVDDIIHSGWIIIHRLGEDGGGCLDQEHGRRLREDRHLPETIPSIVQHVFAQHVIMCVCVCVCVCLREDILHHTISTRPSDGGECLDEGVEDVFAKMMTDDLAETSSAKDMSAGLFMEAEEVFVKNILATLHLRKET